MLDDEYVYVIRYVSGTMQTEYNITYRHNTSYTSLYTYIHIGHNSDPFPNLIGRLQRLVYSM